MEPSRVRRKIAVRMSVGRGPVFAGPLNYFVSCLSWARKTIVEKAACRRLSFIYNILVWGARRSGRVQTRLIMPVEQAGQGGSWLGGLASGPAGGLPGSGSGSGSGPGWPPCLRSRLAALPPVPAGVLPPALRLCLALRLRLRLSGWHPLRSSGCTDFLRKGGAAPGSASVAQDLPLKRSRSISAACSRIRFSRSCSSL